MAKIKKYTASNDNLTASSVATASTYCTDIATAANTAITCLSNITNALTYNPTDCNITISDGTNVIWNGNNWATDNLVDYSWRYYSNYNSVVSTVKSVESIYKIPAGMDLYEGLIVYAIKEQECYIWHNNKFERLSTYNEFYKNPGSKDNDKKLDLTTDDNLILLYFL